MIEPIDKGKVLKNAPPEHDLRWGILDVPFLIIALACLPFMLLFEWLKKLIKK